MNILYVHFAIAYAYILRFDLIFPILDLHGRGSNLDLFFLLALSDLIHRPGAQLDINLNVNIYTCNEMNQCFYSNLGSPTFHIPHPRYQLSARDTFGVESATGQFKIISVLREYGVLKNYTNPHALGPL